MFVVNLPDPTAEHRGKVVMMIVIKRSTNIMARQPLFNWVKTFLVKLKRTLPLKDTEVRNSRVS